MGDDLTGPLGQVGSPEDLRRFLDLPGMDDQMIDGFVTGIGADTVLDRTFALMAERFQPKGRLRSGVVQWNIAASTGRYRYQLVLDRTGAAAMRGGAARPRVVLAMTAPTLLHLCAGRLNRYAAFRSKAVRIRGDIVFGVLMPRWFAY